MKQLFAAKRTTFVRTENLRNAARGAVRVPLAQSKRDGLLDRAADGHTTSAGPIGGDLPQG